MATGIAAARAGRSLFVFVAPLLFAAGCGRNAPPPAPPPDVWATVDGRQIREEDVEKAYRRLTQGTPSEDEQLAARLEIVGQMIDQEILLTRAQQRGVSVSDADVDAAFKERRGNMSDEAFQKELADRKLTTDDLKRDLRRELTVQKLIEQDVTSRVSVTDDEVRDFFEKNRGQFNVAETQYRIGQIIITPVREAQIRNRLNDDATSPAEAQKKAQMIAQKLKEGVEFSALAMDYSEDPQSAPQGGDLGFVAASALNRLPPQLRDVVLKTNPGAVSSVGGGGAYTFVLVAGREPAGQRDLNSPGVRDTITKGLRDRREQLLRAAYLASARNDAKVMNYFAGRVADKFTKK